MGLEGLTSAAKAVEAELNRWRVSDRGTGRCRGQRHHWLVQFEDAHADAAPRERWTCSVCARSQWRERLGHIVGRRERYSRWSTTTTEDIAEYANDSDDDLTNLWRDPAA